jgi:hypothetical protein
MKRPTSHLLFTIILFLVGALSYAYAFWSVDHPLPSSWTNLTIAIGIFVVCFIWAFVRFLQWRDSKHSQFIRTQPTPPDPKLEGTIWGLIPGSDYRVIKPFTDFYQNSFEKDEMLRFQTRHFLPYHGGHTIIFENRQLYLQEDRNKEILDNFSEYIAPIK